MSAAVAPPVAAGAAAVAGTSAAAAGAEEPASKRARVAMAVGDSDFSSELLKVYYSRLFPHDAFFEWLSYGHGSPAVGAERLGAYMCKREISFTLEDDVYVRYQSYKSADELRKGITNRVPHKIDIGPMYSADPQRRAAYAGGAFHPVEREFVIDVDLTDYNDVYPEVDPPKPQKFQFPIMQKYWPLMAAAVKVIDEALREDFGFSEILWVFSGRRGVHCWVCDARARTLTDEQRSAVAEYFNVFKGSKQAGPDGEGVTRSNVSSPLHPALERAKAAIEPIWREQVLATIPVFEGEDAVRRALALIPNGDLRAEVGQSWAHGRGATAGDHATISQSRWAELVRLHARAAKTARGPGSWALRKCVDEILFTYMYPRIDLEVSKKMNHLLKSPFCVHPKTSRVCVPFDGSNPESFAPIEVPTLGQLVNELDSSDGKRTAMDDAVDTFRKTFLNSGSRNWRAQAESAGRAAGGKDMTW
eukprot:PRCOL_00003494-RA